MIKFRQKIFFIGAALTAASIPLTAASMVQSSNQAEAAESQSSEQIKAINAQTRAINNLAKQNPTLAGALTETKTYSMKGKRRKLFAATTPGFFSKCWETAKNLHKANPKLAEQAKFGLGMGATMGVGTYIAGKIINNDAKKEGIDLAAAANQNKMSLQKSYSSPTAPAVTGATPKQPTFLGKAKKLLGGQALNVGFAGMSGIGEYGSWQAEKAMLKNMQKQTTTMQQKQFGAGLFLSRTFKKLGNISGNVVGVGNSRMIKATGAKLSKEAGNNNVQKSVGDFLSNHKWAGTAIGTGVGLGAFSLGNKVGETVVKAPTEAIDPSAYNWQKYQNSKVQE